MTSKLVAALYREPWYGMFAFKVAQQYESTIDPMGKEAASYQAAPSELIGIVADKVDRYRGTIEAQRARLQRKLHAPTRVGLVRAALAAGLIDRHDGTMPELPRRPATG